MLRQVPAIMLMALSILAALRSAILVSADYMAGFVGTVDAIDMDKKTVRVIVSMMGKEVPVELELTQVQPLQ